MDIKNHKEQWLDAIAKGKAGDAIEEVLGFFQTAIDNDTTTLDSTYFNQIVLLAGRWRGVDHEVGIGIISSADEKLERNRITASLVDFLRDLPDDINAQESPDADLIQKKILDTENHQYEYDFFLCYSSKDKNQARAIWEKLRGLSFKVFLSEESLRLSGGESYFEKIQHSLQKSKNFILVCSDNSLGDSTWVEIEYQTFFNEFYVKDKANRRIYLIKARGFQEKDLPLLLRRIQLSDDVDSLIMSILNLSKRKAGSPVQSRQLASSSNTKKGLFIGLGAVLALLLLAFIFRGALGFGEQANGSTPIDTPPVEDTTEVIDNTDELPEEEVIEEPQITLTGPPYRIPEVLDIRNESFDLVPWQCNQPRRCRFVPFQFIGWSEDEKYIAYMTQHDNEAAGGFGLIIQVQNIENDKIEWEWKYGIGEGHDNLSDDIVTVWNEHYDMVEYELAKYAIRQTPTAASITEFPYPVNNRTYSVRLDREMKKHQFFGMDVLDVETIRVFAEGMGSKIVYYNKHGDYPPLYSQLVGGLVSPQGNKVAFIKANQRRGWEGPPHLVEVELIGCDLVEGFR